MKKFVLLQSKPGKYQKYSAGSQIKCRNTCVRIVSFAFSLLLIAQITLVSANEKEIVTRLSAETFAQRQIDLRNYAMPDYEKELPTAFDLDFPLEQMKADVDEIWEKRRSGVPLYNQRDYPDVPFSQGSVATSGCGITCMAMAAAHIYGRDFSPGEFGLKYNGIADNNRDRMTGGAEDLGLSWDRIYTWDETIRILSMGYPVVILVDYNTIFTTGGHFVLATSINEDGKIMINDPNGDNWYKNTEMMHGYAYGFDQEEFTKGFCGSWVFYLPTNQPN